jgi:hypothetical protein
MIPRCCHIFAVIVLCPEIDPTESTCIDSISLIPDTNSVDTTDDCGNSNHRSDNYSDDFFVESEFHRETDEFID